MGSALILAIINGLSVASLHYVQSLLPQITRDLQLTTAGGASDPDGNPSRSRRQLGAFFGLGSVALVPYLLPAYVSGLIPDALRGRTLAIILSIHFTGLLLSRSVGGLVGQHLGWRTIDLFSALLLMGVAWWIRANSSQERNVKPIAYFALQSSQLVQLRRYPGLRQARLSQGLQFGAFMALWSGLFLHLAAGPWCMGSGAIGAFSLVGIISILAAPRIGRLVDHFGSRRLVIASTLASFLGIAVLFGNRNSLVAFVLALLFWI